MKIPARFLLLGGLVALAVPLRAADDDADPVSLLLPASDLPRLHDRGMPRRRGGDYRGKVGPPARQSWSPPADGQTLTLTPKVEGDETAPSWQALGAVRLSADEPVKVRVAG